MVAVQDQTLVDLVNEVFRLFRTLKNISHESNQDMPRLAHLGILTLLMQSGECRASELAERIGVGPSALSRQLADLEQEGMITRKPDPEDGRASLIAASDGGIQLVEQMQIHRAERMRLRLADWDQERAETTLRAVADLAQALRPSPPGPDS